MNLTEATTMVTKLFEISNQLNPTYVSNANIIESFKKWVKLVKPHRDTIPSAIDSLTSRCNDW